MIDPLGTILSEFKDSLVPPILTNLANFPRYYLELLFIFAASIIIDYAAECGE